MELLQSHLKTPLLNGSCVDAKRDELKRYFLNSWQSYESLFSLINQDCAYFLRPEPLRHPLIFYYGHTATFFINKLMLGKYISSRINEKLEAICAVGVDEMSWDDLDSAHYDWPQVDEVKAYREQVKQLVCTLIDNMELSLPITQDSLAWVILMGTEHERIHLETSSVIMRMLPLDYLTPSPQWQACKDAGQAPQNSWVAQEGKQVSLGKSDANSVDEQVYGWDNEYGRICVDVPDFCASKYLISNQEYLAFVEAGGYQNAGYWTEEGQSWLGFLQSTNKANMPRFWREENGQYFQRNLLEEIPLPMNWPVEVNYLEAKAYCNWLSQQTGEIIRLPSEPEWYLMRELVLGDAIADGEDNSAICDNNNYAWQEEPGNINLAYFASSCPVNRFEQQGLYDVVGNVWQWTESSIDAFEGFKVHPLYDDFSTPTFDGKHNLIKGGSWISTGNEATKHSRYAFRRHFFQHAGFRTVRAANKHIPLVKTNHFETDPDISQQLNLHYQQPEFITQNYQFALAEQVKTWLDKYQAEKTKLLDLGCSVGRTSFELSTDFEHVDGVDFSARYIQHGVQLQQEQCIRFALENEGDIVDFIEVKSAILGLATGANILFSQGDASNLKALFTDYDVILVQQLIESHYHSAEFFKQAYQRLNNGGLLIVATDYGFNEQVAEKTNWFGGIKVNGENVTGFDGLYLLLNKQFSLLEQVELVQEKRANQRNVSLSKKHVTLWQKNVD